MFTYLMILLALFNGLLIVTTRVINAKLGLYVSGTGASFWNHFVGWLFLLLVLPFIPFEGTITFQGIPAILYFGGLIGAVYVVINNLVIPRVGATKATVFIVAGQIVLGTVIDALNGKITNLSVTLLGITLVVLGMWLGNQKWENAS